MSTLTYENENVPPGPNLEPSLAEHSKVTVIVPVYNEASHIQSCIGRILDNGYPKELLEILVIDGMSTDGTREIVRGLESIHPEVRLLDNPRRLPYTALNIGLEAATGDFIMRVDARSVIPKDYIAQLQRTLLRTGADNVGGMQRPIVRGTVWERAIALATMSRFGTGGAQFRSGRKSGFVDTVYLGFFRREIFARVGKFDEDGSFISEDAMLNNRIIRSGGKVFLNRNIEVLYHGKETLGQVAKQYFIYGAAKCHSVLSYKRFTALRQLIPVATVLVLYFHLVLAWFVAGLWTSLSIAAGAYLIALFAASTRIALRVGDPMLVLPSAAVLPVIHGAWAHGFLLYLLMGERLGRFCGR
jgi:glycosyltransferase involved in cell wall biosynthesis